MIKYIHEIYTHTILIINGDHVNFMIFRDDKFNEKKISFLKAIN